MIIGRKKYLREVKNLTDFILNSGVIIYRGSPDRIFNGLLHWTGKGSGYIGNRENLPSNSVDFWICDKSLELHNKHYQYPTRNYLRKIPYVGFTHPVDSIPAGILMRVSLARWWKPENADVEERCYLQLSGWYD